MESFNRPRMDSFKMTLLGESGMLLYLYSLGTKVIKLALPVVPILILVTAVVGLQASCFTPSSLTNQSVRTTAEVEEEIYRLVNEERQSSGLKALYRDHALDTLALQFSATAFSESFEQSSYIHYLLCNTWWVTYSGGRPELHENTAREQVDYCLEKYELRQAMFRSDARASGIGIAIINDTIYYAQVFDVLNAMCGDGEPVTLYENPLAEDPSWGQLTRFIVDDDTDEQPYVAESFVCADFAATLHDRAETAGIKAAYVSVDFTDGPGHALNAFNTTDRGLVFIDCTGQGLNVATSSGITNSQGAPATYDKVAYISTGNTYGLINLDNAFSFDYQFYEQWLDQWEEYQAEIYAYEQKSEAYEDAVGGRTVITDPEEYEMLQRMYKELETIRAELEAMEAVIGTIRWEPLGVVTDFYIHW